MDIQRFAKPGDGEAVGDALATNGNSEDATGHLTARTSVSSAGWRKSTRSGDNGCVEVGLVDGQIAVRDSKDRQGPMLMFGAHEWEAFLGGARDGEFELPRLQQAARRRP